MLNRKRLPYDKTVVAEFKIQLADVLSRTVRLQGSVASPISTDSPFNNGDTTVDAEHPLVLENVSAMVVLYCFDSFMITITDDQNNSVTIPCSGLYIHQGKAARITVSPTTETPKFRIKYLWS